MADKSNTPSVVVIDADTYQKQSEMFQTAMDCFSRVPEIIKGLTEKVETIIEESVELRSYSILEAAKVSGIGYKKLNAACKRGELPFFTDGKTYKIQHAELKKYINNQQKKFFKKE